MKKMNDIELEMVAGGITNLNQQWTDCATGENAAPDGFFSEVFGTAWEVIKHAIDVCG